jgi:hypothetical protein
MLSAKQCILCSAEIRYNRKHIRVYGGGGMAPPLDSRLTLRVYDYMRTLCTLFYNTMKS